MSWGLLIPLSSGFRHCFLFSDPSFFCLETKERSKEKVKTVPCYLELLAFGRYLTQTRKRHYPRQRRGCLSSNMGSMAALQKLQFYGARGKVDFHQCILDSKDRPWKR